MHSTNAILGWQFLPALELTADAALRADWDRLNDGRRGLPILSASQVGIALEHFGRGQQLLAVGRQADGPVCAMFVLERDGCFKWRSFQPSQLPLGPWVSDGHCALAFLARSLQRCLPGPCLALTISQVDPWLEPRPSNQAAMETVDYIETSWIDVEGSFDAYWEARGKDLKQNLKRRRKRLAEDGKESRLGVQSNPTEMADAVRRFGQLESAGWKGQQGTALHADNVQGRYYTQAMEAAAAQGLARIYDYWVGDQCVAVDLCALRDDVLIVLKITYDESLKNISPAFMLREEQTRHLFTEGRIRRVEFYGRFMEWHSRWTDKTRVLYHQTVFRWAWVQQLAQTLRRRRAARPAPGPDAG